jgi:hypothetical protein
MAQAIYIPTLFRARIACTEAKRSTIRSRSASVRLFCVSDGLGRSSSAFLRFAECRLRTPQLTAIMAGRTP